MRVKRLVLLISVVVLLIVTTAVLTSADINSGNFHSGNRWLHRLGYYYWGDYLCVQLDGPFWADWDLYVWRERYHTSYTLYVAGPVCSSTGSDADEYCCTCIWTTGYYWSEVRYLHGSGTAHLRWGINRGGCR